MKKLLVLSLIAFGAVSAIAQPGGTNQGVKDANKAVEEIQPLAAKALVETRYDEAITLYTKLLGHVPGDPSVHNNLAIAHMRRAGDLARSASGKYPETAIADLREALRHSTASVTNAAKRADTPKLSIAQFRGTHAEVLRLVAARVDRSQADAAYTAYKEYFAVENDADRKAAAQRNLAMMLYEVESFKQAVPEFEAVLGKFPADHDLLFGYAASIVFSEDKSRHQQAANNLKRFLEIAPASHAQRPSAQELLELLKAEGITPK